GAVHKESIVNLVHVILTEEQFVKRTHFSSHDFRRKSLGAIELVGQPDAGNCNGDGGNHQTIFRRGGLRNRLGGLHRSGGGGNRLEKLFELIAAAQGRGPADPTTDDREHS